MTLEELEEEYKAHIHLANKLIEETNTAIKCGCLSDAKKRCTNAIDHYKKALAIAEKCQFDSIDDLKKHITYCEKTMQQILSKENNK